jgi:hypothetical protein
MENRTYITECLKLAERGQSIAVERHFNLETGCDAWLELKKIDDELRDKIVPELARRLNRASNYIRAVSERVLDKKLAEEIKALADELEAPLKLI